MKIKDLPEDASLMGTRFIYPPDGKPYYWFSQWESGIWGKTQMSDSQIHPLVVNDIREALEWQIAQ
jgi:hypothetical protein